MTRTVGLTRWGLGPPAGSAYASAERAEWGQAGVDAGASASGADAAAGRIPGQPSEHKGKFGTSRRMASRTKASSTTVSPS